MKFKKSSFDLFAAVLLGFALSSVVFSQVEKKVAQGILIDNSGSLRSQFPVVIELGKGIVEKTHQRGPLSLFPFNSAGNTRRSLIPVLGIETQDKSLLDKYLESIFVVGGQTALFDGIDVIASHLNERVNSGKDAYAEKIIFLITDGEERTSKLSEKDLINSLKTSGIRVYAVGLVQELDSPFSRKSAKRDAIDFLTKITRETGGRAVIPKSKKVDVQVVLSELFAQ